MVLAFESFLFFNSFFQRGWKKMRIIWIIKFKIRRKRINLKKGKPYKGVKKHKTVFR